MTSTDDNGNTGNNDKPKKKLLIRPPTPPFDLQTEKLGVLKVGHLSMKALIKISPDLDPKKEIDDRELVKSLLLAVVTHPPISEEQQALPLTIDEADQITPQDIHDFAKAFLEREKWEFGTDKTGNPQDPEVALANKIRLQVTQIGESTRKLVDQFKGGLSDTTKRLFMMNTALSERLKEMSGFSSINQFLKDQDRFSSLTASSQLLKEYDRSVAASLFKNTPASARLASDFALPKEPTITPVSLPRAENTPIHRAAKAMTELNKKADSFKETADTMAAAIGVINEAVASALLDFRAKQQRDERSQRISLNIAAGSLLASLVVGLFSLYFSWGSYVLAKSTDSSSSDQKKNAEEIATKQIEILKELSAGQQLQSKLLSQIQSAATAARPTKPDAPKVTRPLP